MMLHIYLGVLALGTLCLDVAVASDDLDDTLKQALFLVKLLKTDFTQILRGNDDVNANSTEEENSTCSLPEDFNSTMSAYETEVTASGVSSTDIVSMTTSTPHTPQPSIPPGAPIMMPNTPLGGPTGHMVMPYANWPALPMGFPPPSGPGRQNFQDENYRFPYRFNRRRMMPDYYYFDSPVNSLGNFRRFGNNPPGDLDNNTPATSQAKTTTSVSSASSEATTLNVGATTASTSSFTTTKLELSSSILLPNAANQSIVLTVDYVNQSALPPISDNVSDLTTISMNQSMLPTTSSDESILATSDSVDQLILATAESAKKSILQTTDTAQQTFNSSTPKHTYQPILLSSKRPKLPTLTFSTLTATSSKRVRHRKRVIGSKATTTLIYNRGKNHHNDRHHHLRQHTTTTETNSKDYLEMSHVATELEKEFDDNDNTENTSNGQDNHIVPHKLVEPKQKRSTKSTTLKVFLQGSSRIPLPFPENNAFCHFYPKNALCGTNM